VRRGENGGEHGQRGQCDDAGVGAIRGRDRQQLCSQQPRYSRRASHCNQHRLSVARSARKTTSANPIRANLPVGNAKARGLPGLRLARTDPQPPSSSSAWPDGERISRAVDSSIDHRLTATAYSEKRSAWGKQLSLGRSNEAADEARADAAQQATEPLSDLGPENRARAAD